jgi:hypothetical protein
MKTCLTLFFTFFMVALAVGQSYRPKEGFVPDSATAVKIAEAVLVPIYGEKQIESEQPLIAKLRNDVWTVSGTLHCPDDKGGVTSHCSGGVAIVRISKADAHILYLIHGK